MKADGTVYVDTAIDVDGFKSGSRDLETAAKNMASKVEDMGKKVEIAVQKSINAFVKQNQAVSQQQEKVRDLQQQLQELEGHKVETDAYKAVNAEIKKLDESINAADAKKRKFLETGGSETSKTFQNLEYDTQQMSAEMDSLLDKKKKLESSGAAYTPVDTSALESKFASETGKLANMNSRLSTSYDELKLKVDTYNQKLHETDNSTKKAAKSTNTFGNRLKSIISGALVFNVISSGLRKMTSYFGTALKSNSEFSASLARLKGALLTAFQPIYEVVLPALITLMRILTAIIQVIGRFFAAITGKSYNQMAKNAEALNNQANAIGGVGDAAEEAEKQLMGFDEINKLSEPDVSSGGGGGGGTGEIAPDFSWTDEIEDRLNRIAKLVLLIGAGLALWKIGSMLPGQLGEILQKIGLVVIALGGLLLMWDGIKDAWENGVDWGNLIEMFGGLTIAAVALGFAFGPIAAGIALIVGGIALLIVAFHDIMENGFNLQNTLLAIGAILATGLGISLLTGSFIPLLIAGIAALLLAFTVATGHGDELIQGLKEVCKGFVDFFTGIFTGDLEKAFAGIENIFGGLTKIAGAVIDGVKDTILGFLDWLDEKTGGKFSGIIQFVKDIVKNGFDNIKQFVSDAMASVKQIFEGFVQFFSGVFTGNWDLAWEGIKNIAKGAINGLISVINTMIRSVVSGINGLFRLLSFNIDLPGGKNIGISLPQFTPPQIPYLAKGAVIPPKSPFMAVLGDQRHGNNIEAPEDLIRKIVREEAGNSAVEWFLNVSFDGDLAQFARIITPKITAQQKKTERALGV